MEISQIHFVGAGKINSIWRKITKQGNVNGNTIFRCPLNMLAVCSIEHLRSDRVFVWQCDLQGHFALTLGHLVTQDCSYTGGMAWAVGAMAQHSLITLHDLVLSCHCHRHTFSSVSSSEPEARAIIPQRLPFTGSTIAVVLEAHVHISVQKSHQYPPFILNDDKSVGKAGWECT